MESMNKIERASKRAKRAAATIPVHEDPRAELRRLVQSHVALTKSAVAIEHMASDRTNRTTGERIPTRIPVDEAVNMLADVKRIRKAAESLETPMLRELRKLPVYKLFLSQVYGVGPVVAAYLCADIDIAKATKPSNLRRFCGMAVINGRLERRAAGVKSAYNAGVRTRLFQMFSAMAKNAAKKSVDRPHGTTSKYLDVWLGVKHREMHSERVDGAANKWRDHEGEWRGGAKAHAHAKGWHKAADVFIEDLYIVWRAIEGLEVWPSYYAAKLGYEHGGKISVNAPRMLTVDDALALVGDVTGRAASAPVDVPEPCADAIDDVDDIAAE